MLDLAIDDRVILDDPLDCAIQELDLLFNTTSTELIGYTDYGTNFEQFLWDLTPSEEEVKKYVINKLQNTFFIKNYMTTIDVKILNGKVRDIYYITIVIKDNSNSNKESQRQRIYQYQ